MAFTSQESRCRYLSEGRNSKPRHTQAVAQEIKDFRQEIEKRYLNNETKNYAFQRTTIEEEISPKFTNHIQFYNSQ